MQNILDIIFKVVYCVGWIVSLIMLFLSRLKLKGIESKIESQENKMTLNKVIQSKEEDKIKNMAKFLCDRCGREENVNNAKLFKEFAVCPDCYNKIQEYYNKKSELQKEVEEAEKRAEEAKVRFTAFSNSFDILENNIAENNLYHQADKENITENKEENLTEQTLKTLGV